MDDREITELFVLRSETAIAELDNKYGAVSTRVASNITGNREDAKECVNDAYLGVWNTVPPAKPNPLVAYLLRIVRNISVNRLIHNSRQKRNLPFYECAEELEYCIKGREDTESIVGKNELVHMIEQFLDTLSSENRFLFVRRYWYTDSYKDISDLTGLNEKVIRARLFRIRDKLKKHLIKGGVDL